MNDVVKEVYNYEYSLANAEKRLNESELISNEDKEIIRKFVQHLKAQGVSTGRLAKYSYHLKTSMERLGTKARDAKRADIERLVAWLQRDSPPGPPTLVSESIRLKSEEQALIQDTPQRRIT
ncbi:MAG: hypothetical protein LYZ66_02715 [Nitrososphaerales archaeon]|nr:hypothetical protein [Nitrososphaerales archaeon]